MIAAMIDLFALANARISHLEKSFEASVQSSADIPLLEFAQWALENSSISINAHLPVISELLNGRQYQNIYDWASEQEHLSGRMEEDILRERLGCWFERRVEFDAYLLNGRLLRYGAMNAGTIGLRQYAPYCVVLTRAFQDGLSEVAYWGGDSLEICFSVDGIFDDQVITQRIAPHSHRHFMVAVERSAEVTNDQWTWPKIVASDDHYFEAAFVGEVLLKSLECVRVLGSEYDRLSNLAFENFGRKLDVAERAHVQDFIQLRRAVVDGKIKVEVIQ